MSTAKIMLYSDDHTIRESLRLALGSNIAGRDVEIIERATLQAAIDRLDEGDIDLVIADGEAVPAGGMGLARQMKDEIKDAPPVIVVVAREADFWLATWSRAEGVLLHPIDPIKVVEAVSKFIKAA